jgi:hypothetical protein
LIRLTALAELHHRHRQVSEHDSDIRIVLSERLFSDRKGSFEKRTRLGMLPLGAQHSRELDKRKRNERMLRSDDARPRRDGPVVQTTRLRDIAEQPADSGEIEDSRRHARVIRPEVSLVDSQGIFEIRPCLRVLASGEQTVREIVQVHSDTQMIWSECGSCCGKRALSKRSRSGEITQSLDGNREESHVGRNVRMIWSEAPLGDSHGTR